VQERVHPWIAAIFLPIFVFLHTLVPIATPTDVPMSLVWTTVSAIVLGKVLGVGGVLILLSKRLHIAVTEAIAVGCAAAAALTVALIGVAATLDNTPYEQAVSLGILLATAIAFVLGVGAGRLTANKGESDAS
jgi:NhaA family Na+:H+ antiporter